jgi:hypothetical protein
MTHADFCAWLAGYLTDREKPDADVILKKLGELEAPKPFDWGQIGTPVFGQPTRHTSGDPMPIYSYTTCDAAGIPTVASVFASLATGQTRLGADFEAAWSDNTDSLYQS